MMYRILIVEDDRGIAEGIREQARVWGLEAEPENRTLDVHIRTLRAKLGSQGGLIETVRGVGYKLV